MDSIPENYLCHECYAVDYSKLLAGMARGEKLWEHYTRKHEILELLIKRNIQWFRSLHVRLTEDNIQAMKNGRKLSGKMSKIVTPQYESAAERGARALLDRLSRGEVQALHAKLVGTHPSRSVVYNALLVEADRLRKAGWEECDAELGVWAELFGCVQKSGDA